jgi:hypothetical protein
MRQTVAFPQTLYSEAPISTRFRPSLIHCRSQNYVEKQPTTSVTLENYANVARRSGPEREGVVTVGHQENHSHLYQCVT